MFNLQSHRQLNKTRDTTACTRTRAGWKATGVDFLYGFSQELMTSNENNNFVIRNLMIKDYPIIIRLSK
jgi:hypothetical protein